MALELIRQALTCPNCGKSRFIAATAWSGRGAGTSGAASYNAANFEVVTPEKHCSCGFTEIPKHIQDLRTALFAAIEERDQVFRTYKRVRTKTAREAREQAKAKVIKADQDFMDAWNRYQGTHSQPQYNLPTNDIEEGHNSIPPAQ